MENNVFKTCSIYFNVISHLLLNSNHHVHRNNMVDIEWCSTWKEKYFCSSLKTIQNLDLQITCVWWHIKCVFILHYITLCFLSVVSVGNIKPHMLFFVTITCHHMSSSKNWAIFLFFMYGYLETIVIWGVCYNSRELVLHLRKN